MQHQMNIAYQNVKIRPLELEDIGVIRIWRNRESNQQWFLDQQHIDMETQLKWFEKYVTREGDYMFVIEETKEINEMVGTIAIYHMENHEAECGRFLIGSLNAKGKGVGKTAIMLCLHAGFKYLAIEKYKAEVYEHNMAALKADHHAGFVDVGSYVSEDGKVMIQIELTKERFYTLYPFLEELESMI